MGKGGSRQRAGRPAHRLKAENASALDVAYLARHGHLDEGNWKRLYWRQYGEIRLEGLVKAFDLCLIPCEADRSIWRTNYDTLDACSRS